MLNIPSLEVLWNRPVPEHSIIAGAGVYQHYSVDRAVPEHPHPRDSGEAANPWAVLYLRMWKGLCSMRDT